MKNWSIKLVVAMMATVAITLLFTGICRMSHIYFPSSIIPIAIAFLLAVCIMMYGIKVVSDFRAAALLAIIPTGIYFCANQWCFYSANETVHYEDISEFLEAKEKPLYFSLGHYYWNPDASGAVEITTERKRHGRVTSTRHKTYLVMPLYADTISSEIKVWLADQYDSKDFDAADEYEELLRLDEIINFELITEDLKNFETAVDYSTHKDKAKDAIFISPLYKEYIKKDTWGLFFLISFIAGAASMALIGFVLDRRDKREAEETAKAEEE